ncbi:MAG: hypothetical protein K2M65_03715 [Muribaculaceae bacterium]|nr:hypothetical protein [Muribaculaceae bacterium]
MNCELTNRFSWHRFGMVARFYYPRLKKQLILYPSLSLLTLLVTIAIANFTFIPYSLLTPLGMLTTLLLWLGPAVFTMNESPETETLLPAKGSEKALFIMLYSIVGIPVLLHLFSFIANFYTNDLIENIVINSNAQHDIDKLGKNIDEIYQIIDMVRHNTVVLLSSMILSVFPCIMTLFVVMRARYHRIIWAIVWNVVYFISIGVMMFIAGFTAAISNDFMGKLSTMPHETPDAVATVNIMDMTIEVVTTIFSAVGIYTLICGIILLILTYRTIVNRQVA